MNRLLVYILLSFFASSCIGIERPKKPDNLISKNKMIDIITDISLVTAAKGMDKKILELKGVNPEKYIYIKYSIDSVQFAESNNYYAFDVKEYEDIYIRVTQRLEEQNKEYKALQEKERTEKDSLRKLKNQTKDSIKRSKLLKEPMPLDLPGKIGKPKQ